MNQTQKIKENLEKIEGYTLEILASSDVGINERFLAKSIYNLVGSTQELIEEEHQ